ncbi:GNAT family N-acetyltransferase [Streptomyces beigongshangae]|uniref:GNAT family N-acetyltransferase n=1 Tax=Streptomyces beigongshangae TaxID=2841597 RepID=UPI001C854AE2|nr:GNAT family N-acetyltransferase [Streptomyces sp. REN17]
MQLLPFGTDHAATVAGWPVSAAEAVMWCGLREFPVAEETVAAWQHAPDVAARVLSDGGRVLGYGELWFDAEGDEVELARIVVAPGARGKGLGRELVRALVAEARLSGLSDVFVRVHPGNAVALRCYRGAGFETVAAASAREWNAGQPVDYVWLRHVS